MAASGRGTCCRTPRASTTSNEPAATGRRSRSAWQTKWPGRPRKLARFASTARDRSQATTRAPASSSTSVKRPAPHPTSRTARPATASSPPRHRASRSRLMRVPVAESSWVRAWASHCRPKPAAYDSEAVNLGTPPSTGTWHPSAHTRRAEPSTAGPGSAARGAPWTRQRSSGGTFMVHGGRDEHAHPLQEPGQGVDALRQHPPAPLREDLPPVGAAQRLLDRGQRLPLLARAEPEGQAVSLELLQVRDAAHEVVHPERGHAQHR